jgi:hypothetical protein
MKVVRRTGVGVRWATAGTVQKPAVTMCANATLMFRQGLLRLRITEPSIAAAGSINLRATYAQSITLAQDCICAQHEPYLFSPALFAVNGDER